MSAVTTIWIMGEHPETYASLCGAARRLGQRVEAIWIGPSDVAASLRTCGADAVRVVPVGEGALFEDGVGAVATRATQERPDAVLLSTSKRMRLAAARIAAELKTRVVNDATRVWGEDDSLLAEHMVYGGSAFGLERMPSGAAVLLLSEGLLASESEPDGPQPDAAIDEWAAEGPAHGFKLVERRPRSVEAVNLAAAKRVISAGRGIAQQEDLRLIEQLAQVLEAEVGCTRPVAEGSNWMARERYIGVSGAMTKPDLFVAVGVSGQVQHMVGANRAKTIVAINKDKNAPVFKQADYGIVGDLYAVLPQLIEELKA